MSFLWPGDGALARVHTEAQAPLDEAGDARHHAMPRPLAAYVDVDVVGISHESVASPCHLLVEFVQHDVAEQRTQGATLHGSFRGGAHQAVGQDTASQDLPRQP